MKRRNRKRKPKAANLATAKIPVDAEKPAGPSSAFGPSTALAGADAQPDPGDEFSARVEVSERGSGPGALAEAEYVIDLSDEFLGTAEEKPVGPSVAFAEADHLSDAANEVPGAAEMGKPAGSSVAPSGADRRIHPRYEFIAAGEVVTAESGARIETRVRDLSQQGC